MRVDLDAFVDECAIALRERDRAGALRSVLDRIGRDPGGVADALGDLVHGGITALHHAPDLTILKVVWTPRMKIGAHDHQMLAGIVVYGGREDNTFFRRIGDRVEPAGGRTVQAGEAMLLGEDAIHGVRNPEPRYTGAIHVYAGDFFARKRSMWRDDGEPDPDPASVEEIFERAERTWRAASALDARRD
jgi:hypothetical protein